MDENAIILDMKGAREGRAYTPCLSAIKNLNLSCTHRQVFYGSSIVLHTIDWVFASKKNRKINSSVFLLANPRIARGPKSSFDSDFVSLPLRNDF